MPTHDAAAAGKIKNGSHENKAIPLVSLHNQIKCGELGGRRDDQKTWVHAPFVFVHLGPSN